jgi:replication factor C large subunit
MNNTKPWVEKYRPKSIRNMALPSAKIKRHKVDLAEELRKFIINFFKEKQNLNEKNIPIKLHNRTHGKKEQKKKLSLASEKSAVLLEGPPGVGKTSIVYALANDLDMDVIETNASDVRTKNALQSKLSETIKSKSIMDYISKSKKKLILIDEVDGIYGASDRGAVPTILSLIEDTQFPIIMCSNEYKQNLQSLYNKVSKYEISPLSNEEMMKVLKSILKNENITGFKDDDLILLIEKNHGDLRGLINDLQGITQGQFDKKNLELIGDLHRDSTEEIFGLIQDLFLKVSSLKEAKILTSKSDVDYNFLYKWVNENLPTFIKMKPALSNAYENLSIADEIFGRIQKNQYWSLLPYFFDLFAGGVALTRKKSSHQGFHRVSFPRYSTTGYFSLTASEQSLAEKIKEKYDISEVEIIQNFLPFIRMLCNYSRKQLKNVSDWLELDASEKKILKKD